MAANKKGGYAVLFADPDKPGEYTERSPWERGPGKRYTEADREALDNQVETLIIVEYVKGWRGNEQNAIKIV
jgi:hypothetical protein